MLAGRTVIVSGAARGVGRAIATVCANADGSSRQALAFVFHLAPMEAYHGSRLHPQ